MPSGKRKVAKSPYNRYSKRPYEYKFRNCAHNTTVYQESPDWKGYVCTICNSIVATGKRKGGKS